MVFTYAIPVEMGYLDDEEQIYWEDVAAVKKWWEDSRWRYTKRPFTAEQIVQKRGNLKIDYPSNAQAKKLWKIIEGRFAVCYSPSVARTLNLTLLEQRCILHVRLPRADHAYSDGQIPRYGLCLWMAILQHRFLYQ